MAVDSGTVLAAAGVNALLGAALLMLFSCMRLAR
jgi:hypothetical protein